MPSYPVSSQNAAIETTPLLSQTTSTALSSAFSIHTIPPTDDSSSTREELGILISYLFPIMSTQLLEYSLFVVTIASTGHLGVRELAAASLSVMSLNLVSFSIIQGMSTALDTLCPQAYTSPNPKETSLHALRTFYILVILLIPQTLIFWNSETILLALKQDAEVARLTCVYLRTMILALPAYSAFECIRRYLQAQGRLSILVVTLLISAVLNAVLNWVLVWGPEPVRLGFVGAPMSTVVSMNMMCVITLIYSAYFSTHEAWGGLSMDIFTDLGENLTLGVAGTAMVASEWWCWEIFSLASSYLGPTTLAAQSVLVSTQGFMFQPQYALSVAVSIRVGNLLGAQKPVTAQLASRASIVLVVIIASILFTVLMVWKDQLSGIFSEDEGVRRLASEVIPLLALFQLTDGVTTSNNGVLRGAGRSALGAKINLVAYYLVSLPIGLLLAFKAPLAWNLRGLRGIWTGISVAIGATSLLTSWFVYNLDWDREADAAWERTRSKSLLGSDDEEETSGVSQV
ncbi:multidrug/Oligosaccharidyl-lipid/Polysaccharide flippase [Meredithblackwellia eburnea MCA 4105]